VSVESRSRPAVSNAFGEIMIFEFSSKFGSFYPDPDLLGSTRRGRLRWEWRFVNQSHQTVLDLMLSLFGFTNRYR
jgi:hypothetical protein